MAQYSLVPCRLASDKEYVVATIDRVLRRRWNDFCEIGLRSVAALLRIEGGTMRPLATDESNRANSLGDSSVAET